MRSSIDVHNYLQTEGIQHEIFALESSAKTAKHMAAILGLKPGEIAKVLIFVADGEPIMVIIPGDKKADRGKIKKTLGKDKIKFADVRIVLDITDYCIGATPPVAHKKEIPCLVDSHIMKRAIIYTGGGEASMVLKMRSDDLKKVTKGKVAEICC